MGCLAGLLIAPFFLFLLLFYCYYCYHSLSSSRSKIKKGGMPTRWPVVGMLPALLSDAARIHVVLAGFFARSPASTVRFVGPRFTGMEILTTVDPSNVHHVMSKNFDNYRKGPKFYEMFDILGQGIFNSDGDLWRRNRRIAHAFFVGPSFQRALVGAMADKIGSGLAPVLDRAAALGHEVDLQDLFGRLTFDTICSMVVGHDPGTLAVGLPYSPVPDAFKDAEEALAYRHVLPTPVWKLQRWLRLGREGRHRRAWRVLDGFIQDCIDRRLRRLEDQEPGQGQGQGDAPDMFALLRAEGGAEEDSKYLRDTILSFIFAGQDSTSAVMTWLFYLLTENPGAIPRIREEVGSAGVREAFLRSPSEERMVYLHGAICEALRLYPPLAFNVKTPVGEDVLPSGHRVGPRTQILFSLYAMGRMRSLWGDDCRQFRPERWVSPRGGPRHEPPSKFLAFSAGPRTCVGKAMAFTQLKMVAAAVVQRYDLVPVEGQEVVPTLSVILRTKHGFKVKVLRRS